MVLNPCPTYISAYPSLSSKKGLQQAIHERKHSAQTLLLGARKSPSNLTLIASKHVHLPAWRGFIRQAFKRILYLIFK